MPDTKRVLRLGRRALLTGLLGSVVLALAQTTLAETRGGAISAPQDIAILAQPIPHFDRGQPTQKQFGDLEYRGGLVLTSASADFGGWSALIMAPDGKSLLAVSDVGGWLTADLAYEDGRPARLSRARIGPLLSASGNLLKSKVEQDAEGATLLEGNLSNGTLLISFERHHRIGRFPIRDGVVQAPTDTLKLPAEVSRMRANQGIEAIAAVKSGPLKGSVVGFAERLTGGSGYHTGLIWPPGGGAPRRFQLADIDGFNITDTAALPDGDLLVLERRFNWAEGVKMRLRRLTGKDVVPNARLDGRTLLEADGNYQIDNMEGMAVHRNAGGEVILTLISDDNFSHFLQRTVLLQFKLRDAGAPSIARRSRP